MKKKPTLASVIAQLFDNGPYTSLIHNAAIIVSNRFFAPSGATSASYYTAADRHAYAVAVREQAIQDTNSL